MNDLSRLIKKYLDGHCTPEEARIVEEFVKHLLERFADGEATEEERKLVGFWLQDGEHTLSEEDAAHLLGQQSTRVWARLEQHFRRVPSAPVVPVHKPRWSPQRRWYATVAAAAAVLFILFTLQPRTSLTTPTQEVVAEAEISERFSTEDSTKRLVLADGSVIHLNQKSALALRKGKFNAHTREVWLEEGEAFFEIAKDPERPFLVHTPDGLTTKVLGTSFNIQAYPQLPQQVITVKSGKVQVSSQAGNRVYLEPDQAAAYSADDQWLTATAASGTDAADWRNGRVVLSDATFEEVALRLWQHHRVELLDHSGVAEGTRVYFTFSHKNNLREIAIALADIYGVQFQISKNQLILLENRRI